MSKKGAVILGAGPGGISAAKAIRKNRGDLPITILTAGQVPYYRMLLPYLLRGAITESSFFERAEELQRELKVELKTNVRIRAIDTESQTVLLEDQEIPYTDLVIATGAYPYFPSIFSEEAGVHALWSLEDARDIMREVKDKDIEEAVVIGAGFVGLQAAEYLYSLGIRCTIIEIAEQILPKMIDVHASELIIQNIRKTNVRVLTNTKIQSIVRTNKGEKVIILADGSDLCPDIIIACTGTRPNIDFIDHSKIKVNKGIMVDARMQTSVANVYAVGDVAEGIEYISGQPILQGNQLNAIEQGTIAGLNIAGQAVEYRGSLRSNILNVFGLTVISVGDTKEDAFMTSIVSQNSQSSIYKKLYFRNEVLVGGIVVGDPQEAGIIRELILKKEPFAVREHYIDLREKLGKYWVLPYR